MLVGFVFPLLRMVYIYLSVKYILLNMHGQGKFQWELSILFIYRMIITLPKETRCLINLIECGPCSLLTSPIESTFHMAGVTWCRSVYNSFILTRFYPKRRYCFYNAFVNYYFSFVKNAYTLLHKIICFPY